MERLRFNYGPRAVYRGAATPRPQLLRAMLPAVIRYKLHFGPYRSPRFRLGAIIKDEIRGEVTIVGLTDGRIR